MPLTAPVSNISRASVHDGPGLRTVVFFKGCSLRCKWCHNPETQQTTQDIMYNPTKCIGCGRCIKICPEHHTVETERHVFRREGCRRCGKCSDACPTRALEQSGHPATVEEVMKELVKDRHFYTESGGGVTFSGGECLLHTAFVLELLKGCRAEQIHTAIETALCVKPDSIDAAAPLCDLFLADLKIPDPDKHKYYTGQDNALIIDNLYRLAAGSKVLVRIPLIPGVNDSMEDIRGFARILGPVAGRIQAAEVLKYNPLAKSKYDMSGRSYTDFGESQSDREMLDFCSALKNALGNTAEVITAVSQKA